MADDATAPSAGAPAGRRPGARLRRCPISPTIPRSERVLDAAARKGVDARGLDLLRVDPHRRGRRRGARRGAGPDRQVARLRRARRRRRARAVLCLVSGPNRVDLARLAAVIGEPRIRRASAREAHDLTGFTIGGIPPIGHAKPMRVVMDPDLGRFRDRVGGGRPPDRGVPGPAGDAADPVQRDGRADRRGASARPTCEAARGG